MKLINILKTMIILSILLLLTGCWDYRDIETTTIATGLAIDYNDSTNEYELSIEVIDTISTTEKSSKTITVRGDTVFSAVRNAIPYAGKKLFWSHCKVLVISSDLAKKDISPALDWCVRDAETKTDLTILIAKNSTAGEILKSNPLTNTITSYFLSDTINSASSVSQFPEMELLYIINDIGSNNEDSIIPTVSLESIEGEVLPYIDGSAILKDTSIIHYLNGAETKLTLLFLNKLHGGIYTIKKPAIEARSSLELLDVHCNFTPVIGEDKITMEMNCSIRGMLTEVNTFSDLSDPAALNKFQKDYSEQLTQDILALFKKAQDYKTDIFGFAGIVQRKQTSYYRGVESYWDSVFATIKLIPTVDVEIVSTGTAIKTLESGGQTK